MTEATRVGKHIIVEKLSDDDVAPAVAFPTPVQRSRPLLSLPRMPWRACKLGPAAHSTAAYAALVAMMGTVKAATTL
jgi:hypothetical protein